MAKGVWFVAARPVLQEADADGVKWLQWVHNVV
jgi:hypothetical protein